MPTPAEATAPPLAAPDAPGPRDDGVWLATADDTAVDLLVDGNRVWSFNPSRDAEARGGALPGALAGRAAEPAHRGRARRRSRAPHRHDAVRRRGAARRTSGEPLRFVDDQGHPLAISNTGKLERSFADRDPEAVEALISTAEAAMALIREQAGIPVFIAYGTLLGAVRDGHLIGHDVDMDLGIVTRSPFPVDAVRASFYLERLFRRAGWGTWRFSAADFKVKAPGVEGHGTWIDIFGGFYADGIFYLMGRLAVPAGRVSLLPLSEVELEGHRLAAPAEPAGLLEAAYGPSWRLPDPSFRPRTPRSTRRRVDAWVRSAMAHRGYWYRLYGNAPDTVPTTPSPFARWFAGREGSDTPVVDLGCGNGRDALWLAAQGYDVRGYDYAPAALSRARTMAHDQGVEPRFQTFNLYDTRHALALGGLLSHEPEPVNLYGRFLLHALTELGVGNLWRLARMALRRGGRLYLEFLAPAPDAEPGERAFPDHFRNPLDPAAVTDQIEAAGGWVEFQETGRGLGIYQNDDPYLCRMVARWSH